ncbi:MAG: helix-turn-helix transcriptional regulator [Tissierellia bacterium]|nr:helix-turn-helix transcriptional regulator [Tissierellia bacterium]
MANRFDDFIEKIPKNIHNNTRTFIGENIAVFIPDTYVFNKPLVNKDYHFVIFHSSPPLAIVNNKEYQFKNGTLLCMSPGTEITVKSIKGKVPIKYVAINIDSGFLENILTKIGGNKKIKPVIHDNQYSYKTLDLLEFFMQEFIYLDYPSKIIIESIETQIVIQLLRDMGLDPIVNKINHSQEKSYVEQSIKYIESYYNSNITINEICNTIYISPCHFQRIFKNATNKTPYQYITEFRISKSKEKLKDGKTSINEIARQCGFLSGGHFSTVFKKKEGQTPSEYRSSLKLKK